MNILAQVSQELNFWVHDLSPFLVRFPEAWPWPLGGNGIRWYGVSYISGFITGYLLILYYYQKHKSPYSPSKVSDLATYIIVGVMLGGRLGYMLFYDLGELIARPQSIFEIWRGGMASHGGILGVAVATILFARHNKESILKTGDIIVSAASPGLCFGRLANFMNGELWGHPSTVPWAIIFPEADGLPRHPSQLYEAATEGVLLFIYMQLRFWGKLGKKPANGQLIGEFLMGYSIVRIFCEIFREPDASLIFGFSRGQFFSIGTLLAGAAFVWFSIRQKTAQAMESSSGK